MLLKTEVRNEKNKTVEVIDKKFEFILFPFSLSKKKFLSLKKMGSYFNLIQSPRERNREGGKGSEKGRGREVKRLGGRGLGRGEEGDMDIAHSQGKIRRGCLVSFSIFLCLVRFK